MTPLSSLQAFRPTLNVDCSSLSHSKQGQIALARHLLHFRVISKSPQGACLKNSMPKAQSRSAPLVIDYSMMEATMPAPTVRPPSRIAKRSFSSIAIGTISSTSTVTLSPGMTISVPSGSDTMPVTSVVRK